MNNYGYVISYQCCKGIELAFYTTVVRMNKTGLQEFYDQVYALYQQTDPDTDHNIKRFGIQVDTNTRMVLTYFELKQLMDMVAESQLIIRAYDIIES